MLSNIKLLCNNTKILDNYSNMYSNTIDNESTLSINIINKYQKKTSASIYDITNIFFVLMKLILILISHFGNNKENSETTIKLTEIYNDIRILYNNNNTKTIKIIKKK
jgi:hypothetical protein